HPPHCRRHASSTTPRFPNNPRPPRRPDVSRETWALEERTLAGPPPRKPLRARRGLSHHHDRAPAPFNDEPQPLERCRRPLPHPRRLARDQAAPDSQEGGGAFGCHGRGREPSGHHQVVAPPLGGIPPEHFGPPARMVARVSSPSLWKAWTRNRARRPLASTRSQLLSGQAR